MKDGLIVYLVGGAETPAGASLKTAARALGHEGQQVEVVSAAEGFFTVDDAWHFLLTRGCGRIHMLVAAPAGPGSLRPLSPPVRLCG
jgi:hypothetical protein